MPNLYLPVSRQRPLKLRKDFIAPNVPRKKNIIYTKYIHNTHMHFTIYFQCLFPPSKST